MKNTSFNSNATNVILFFGFSVLIGSFVLFGESLSERLEVASLPSKEEKSIYHQCFEEICKKPVEDFQSNFPDNSGLIDENLDAEILKFTNKYSENEIEIQRLVKSNVTKILNGDLTGEVDFGLFDVKKIYFYQYHIIQSYKNGVSFQAYLRGSFKQKIPEVFSEDPEQRKWAEEGFLFDEVIEVQKLSGRYDLESYSLEVYPNVSDYRQRLKLLSQKIVEASKDHKWLLGFGLKDQSWPAEMYLETGLFNEEDFMDDIFGIYYLKMVEKAMSEVITLEKVRERFQKFSELKNYNLIFDEGILYDAFMSFDTKCRSAINDDLYWASSDLRNRSVEKHFSKLKSVAKTMFEFEEESKKNEFDKKLDRLELIKSRSLQETKGFYPFYFKKLLSSQKKSIEILKSNNFKDTVLYLHGYFVGLPEFKGEGQTPEERESEAFAYINNFSLDNVACRSYDNHQSSIGSFFSPTDNYLYLEMKSLRHFGDGVMTLAHELGHGVSYLLKKDYVFGFKDSVKSDVWSKRSCIDQYYPRDSKLEAPENLQTEEDWADYFAVQLVKEYKKTGDYNWASEKFECEFVSPFHLNPDYGDPMQPYREGDFVDSHSSNLFRMIAQEYYSKGKLGPVCTELAKKETKILDFCK